MPKVNHHTYPPPSLAGQSPYFHSTGCIASPAHEKEGLVAFQHKFRMQFYTHK